MLSQSSDWITVHWFVSDRLPLRAWLWMLIAWVWYWPSSVCTQMRWESAVSLNDAPIASTCSLDLFMAFINCDKWKEKAHNDNQGTNKYENPFEA